MAIGIGLGALAQGFERGVGLGDKIMKANREEQKFQREEELNKAVESAFNAANAAFDQMVAAGKVEDTPTNRMQHVTTSVMMPYLRSNNPTGAKVMADYAGKAFNEQFDINKRGRDIEDYRSKKNIDIEADTERQARGLGSSNYQIVNRAETDESGNPVVRSYKFDQRKGTMESIEGTGPFSGVGRGGSQRQFKWRDVLDAFKAAGYSDTDALRIANGEKAPSEIEIQRTATAVFNTRNPKPQFMTAEQQRKRAAEFDAFLEDFRRSVRQFAPAQVPPPQPQAPTPPPQTQAPAPPPQTQTPTPPPQTQAPTPPPQTQTPTPPPQTQAPTPPPQTQAPTPPQPQTTTAPPSAPRTTMQGQGTRESPFVPKTQADIEWFKQHAPPGALMLGPNNRLIVK